MYYVMRFSRSAKRSIVFTGDVAYDGLRETDGKIGQIPLDDAGKPKYEHYNSDATWGSFWNLMWDITIRISSIKA